MTEEMKNAAINDEMLDKVSGGMTQEEQIRQYQAMKEYEQKKREMAEQAKREEEERLMKQYAARKEAMQSYWFSQAK